MSTSIILLDQIFDAMMSTSDLSTSSWSSLLCNWKKSHFQLHGSQEELFLPTYSFQSSIKETIVMFIFLVFSFFVTKISIIILTTVQRNEIMQPQCSSFSLETGTVNDPEHSGQVTRFTCFLNDLI